MTRTGTKQLVDRLYNEAETKKNMKDKYEQMRLAKETKDCTFMPNMGSSKQLSVSLFRKGKFATELGNVEVV
jgi:hypothetical protein